MVKKRTRTRQAGFCRCEFGAGSLNPEFQDFEKIPLTNHNVQHRIYMRFRQIDIKMQISTKNLNKEQKTCIMELKICSCRTAGEFPPVQKPAQERLVSSSAYR